MVGLGSTLIMLVAIQFRTVVDDADVAKIAGQAVAGIGFLGAGTIINKNGNIDGLTTTSSLWICAGIGLASGMGYYTAAFLTTLVAILTLTIFKGFTKFSLDKHKYIISIELFTLDYNLSTLSGIIKNNDYLITDREVDDNQKGRYDVKYLIKAPHALNIPVFKNDLISLVG